MIVNMLILVIALLSLFQDKNRRTAAIIYSLSLLAHVILFDNLEGQFYYLVAALVDYFVIFILCSLSNKTPLTKGLIYICLTSIIMNFIGWIMWYLYFDPTAYNAVFVAIYGVAVIMLSKGAWDGHNTNNSRGNRIYLANNLRDNHG